MAQLERVTFYDGSEAMNEHRELNVVKYSEIMSSLHIKLQPEYLHTYWNLVIPEFVINS